MKSQLAQLLKNTYTKKELVDQLRQITADTKAGSFISLKGKGSPSEKNLITPDITESLPVVIITLATTLPEEDLPRLGQWFRHHVDPQILLDLRQDPEILGGCQIIWRGFEGDFSLRKKLQEGRANG